MGICRRLWHNFNFVNMSFVGDVIFFPILRYSKGRFTFMESLLQNFVISIFTLTYIPLEEQIPFMENNFLH